MSDRNLMAYRLYDRERARAVFKDWPEAVVWSCLEGVMGDIYVDDLEEIKSAKALLGGFCILSGVANESLVLHKPNSYDRNSITLVPEDESWSYLIEKIYKDKTKRLTRYAIKKERDVFDVEHLKKVASSLSKEYEARLIDEEIFNMCRTLEWCKSFVIQYDNFEFYKKYGLGVVILKDGEIVAGASSYLGFKDGIDIDIHTREDFRRRGLAYISGAILILECLKKGWYPSWDAKNKESVALSEKLGYHFSHEYVAYEIHDY